MFSVSSSFFSCGSGIASDIAFACQCICICEDFVEEIPSRSHNEKRVGVQHGRDEGSLAILRDAVDCSAGKKSFGRLSFGRTRKTRKGKVAVFLFFPCSDFYSIFESRGRCLSLFSFTLFSSSSFQASHLHLYDLSFLQDFLSL